MYIVVLSRIHLPLRLWSLMTMEIMVVKAVGDKVKSVVRFISETVKTSNSLQSDNVDTFKVVPYDFDIIETLDSVKPSKLFDQGRHCKLHSCCNSCTFCVFSRASAKERSKPISGKDQKKAC